LVLPIDNKALKISFVCYYECINIRFKCFFILSSEGSSMDIGGLLTTAASLMLTGMVGVFIFLSILISAVLLMSKLLGRFENSASSVPARTAKLQPQQGVPPAHIAAISAAIAQFRNKQQ
jgi:oxaloacetate decarboxylase gamma subunit